MNPLMEILASGVFAPKPKAQQWVSESGVKFHLEKPVSVAAAMGDFTALCGAAGQFFYDKYEGQTFLRCADCLDVAHGTGLPNSVTHGTSGEVLVSLSASSLPRSSAQGKTGVQSTATDCTPWYFSCVRRGIDGFIADVDRVVDRETAEYQGVE